jgi:hypothetical protein
MSDGLDARGRMRRLLESAGLAHPPGGEPRRASTNALSRYGRWTSRRLDEDLDDLAARVAALEAELQELRSRRP